MKNHRLHTITVLFMIGCLAAAAVNPVADYLTYVLETVPVMIGVVLLLATRNRFQITPVLMILICVHSAILCLGGHYTYAKVPLGFWLQEMFHFSRNPYDRIGHLAQGFVPAILAREILVRQKVVNGKSWLFSIVICICLAFSAFYELIEWFVAQVTGEAAESFLGTQGDVWDTQWDMFMALVGAILSLSLLSRFHDKQLKQLPK